MLQTLDAHSLESSATLTEKEISKFHESVKSGDVTTVLAIIASVDDGDGQRADDQSPQLRNLLEHRDETDDRRTAILQACYRGHFEMVKLLAERGADILSQELQLNEDTAIHIASEQGHIAICTFLLEMQPELIDCRNKRNQSPLWKAASSGRAEVVEYLIEKKRADIEARDESGATPLLVASNNGHLKTVQLLVEKNANVLAKDNGDFESMAIHLACDKGHIDVVSYLLSVKPGLIEARDKFGDLPILRAAAHGQEEIINYLVETMHCDVESKGHLKRTPLLQAVVKQHVHTVQLLAKEKGANVFARDVTDSMAIHLAADKGFIDVISVLLDCEPSLLNAQDKQGDTPLFRAAAAVQLKVLEYIADKKQGSLEARNNQGWTLLIAAGREGRLPIVQMLIRKGADIFARDLSDNGSMTIHLASYHGHLEVVEFLLQHTPQLQEAQETGGETPLYRAAFGGQLNVVRFLVDEKHVNINAVNELGRSAVMAAAREGFLELVQFLVEKGADILIKDQKGNLAVHLAAFYGHTKIVDCFLLAKPDLLEIKDSNGRTPLACALMNDKDETVRFLEEKGAIKKSWFAALLGF